MKISQSIPIKTALGFGAIIGLVVLFSAVDLVPQPPSAGVCLRVPIADPKPLWISSAAFVEGLSQVALIDPLRNKLLLVDLQGKSSAYDEKRWKTGGDMFPAFIHSTQRGFALLTVDPRLIWLNRNLDFVASARLTGTNSGSGSSGSIVSIYDSVVSGDYFYLSGAVKIEEGRYRFGFFRSRLREPANLEFLLDFDGEDVDYYLVGHKYITGLGGDGYALMMNGKPEIIKFPRSENKKLKLNVFPERYRAFRVQAANQRTEEKIFKEIEKLTIPVGVYGQDGLLYLLTREPNGDGRTSWFLHQIEPSLEKILGHLKLPTSASHLTVVNTDHNWYVFEKGSVESQGRQQIESMLVIPNSLIRSGAIPKSCRDQK